VKPGRKRLMGWRKWALRLALLTLVPTLFFILLELGLRAAGYGYPTRFLVRMEGRDVYTGNRKFGWQFFPREMARVPALLTLTPRKAPGTYRIFVLGSSAAMGMPEEHLSVGRFLEVILRDRFPGTRFEVINAAMTAINSHVALPIARDCARCEPDLFIVYMGNNEVIGPFGTGTVFRSFSSNLFLIRTLVWVKSTRTGQLLERLSQSVARKGETLKDWRGMEMFLGNRVAADDPRMPALYRHFRANLADLCRVATRAGAKVIVCTVATNLRDNAPFASLHRADLSEADLARWEEIYRAGVELEAAGQQAKAADRYEEAAQIDDRFADLHFRLARCRLALHQPEEARRHFGLARDLDALRFRADSAINDTIREVASEREGKGAYLVDAERVFAESDRSPDGTPGDGLFYEHVHLRPEGNYLLAAAIFRSLPLPLEGRGMPRPYLGVGGGAGTLEQELERGTPLPLDGATPPSFERCAELLALTDWDRYRMESDMATLTFPPPFTGQLDYRERRALTRQRLQQAATALRPDELAAAYKVYLKAMEAAPEDWHLVWNFALLQDKRGAYAGAEEAWRRVLGLFPDSGQAHETLSIVLLKEGKAEEARAHLGEALRLRPRQGLAQANFGTVLLERGKIDEATEHFRQALRIQPGLAITHNSLGGALAQQGKIEEAIEHFKKAIELDPGYLRPHNNLAVILRKHGKIDEAIAEYRAALKADPDDADALAALGGILHKQGKLDEALALYQAALRVQPDHVYARLGLCAFLADRGEFKEALGHALKVTEVAPGNASARWLAARLLAKQGNLEGAAAQYGEAAALQPGSWEVHYRLARALVAVHKPAEAVPHYRRALGLRPPWAAGMAELAAAEAEAGQFPQAARTARQALELARASENSELVRVILRQLEAYEAGRLPASMPPITEP